MYPNLTIRYVRKPTILKEYIKSLGKEYADAFRMKTIGVLVNGKRLWPSAELKPGDKIVIFPIILGG